MRDVQIGRLGTISAQSHSTVHAHSLSCVHCLVCSVADVAWDRRKTCSHIADIFHSLCIAPKTVFNRHLLHMLIVCFPFVLGTRIYWRSFTRDAWYNRGNAQMRVLCVQRVRWRGGLLFSFCVVASSTQVSCGFCDWTRRRAYYEYTEHLRSEAAVSERYMQCCVSLKNPSWFCSDLPSYIWYRYSWYHYASGHYFWSTWCLSSCKAYGGGDYSWGVVIIPFNVERKFVVFLLCKWGGSWFSWQWWQFVAPGPIFSS